MGNPKERTILAAGSLGNLRIDFKSNKIGNEEPLDTQVNINGQNLCWISWSDKEKFLIELNGIINRYRI